jgi:hypothetical protein
MGGTEMNDRAILAGVGWGLFKKPGHSDPCEVMAARAAPDRRLGEGGRVLQS